MVKTEPKNPLKPPWSFLSMIITSLLFGPIAGLLITWQNLKRLGKRKLGKKFLVGGCLFFFILLFLIPLVIRTLEPLTLFAFPFWIFLITKYYSVAFIVFIISFGLPIWFYFFQLKKEKQLKTKFSWSILFWALIGLLSSFSLLILHIITTPQPFPKITSPNTLSPSPKVKSPDITPLINNKPQKINFFPPDYYLSIIIPNEYQGETTKKGFVIKKEVSVYNYTRIWARFLPDRLNKSSKTSKIISVDSVPFYLNCDRQYGEFIKGTICDCDIIPTEPEIPLLEFGIDCGSDNHQVAIDGEKSLQLLQGINLSPKLKNVLLNKAPVSDFIPNDGKYLFEWGDDKNNLSNLYRVRSDYSIELIAENYDHKYFSPDKRYLLYTIETKKKNEGTCYAQWLLDLNSTDKAINLNSFLDNEEFSVIKDKYPQEKLGLDLGGDDNIRWQEGELIFDFDTCWDTLQEQVVFNLTDKTLRLIEKPEVIPTIKPKPEYEPESLNCYTDEEDPFVLNKESLIGEWQASPHVASGYCARFKFYPSGQYNWFANEMDCATRVLKKSGTWKLENNTLILTEKEKVTLEGGWYERASGSCGSFKDLVGAQEKITQHVQPPVYQISIKPSPLKKVADVFKDPSCAWRPVILLDGIYYWLFDVNPDSL